MLEMWKCQAQGQGPRQPSCAHTQPPNNTLPCPNRPPTRQHLVERAGGPQGEGEGGGGGINDHALHLVLLDLLHELAKGNLGGQTRERAALPDQRTCAVTGTSREGTARSRMEARGSGTHPPACTLGRPTPPRAHASVLGQRTNDPPTCTVTGSTCPSGACPCPLGTGQKRSSRKIIIRFSTARWVGGWVGVGGGARARADWGGGRAVGGRCGAALAPCIRGRDSSPSSSLRTYPQRLLPLYSGSQAGEPGGGRGLAACRQRVGGEKRAAGPAVMVATLQHSVEQLSWAALDSCSGRLVHPHGQLVGGRQRATAALQPSRANHPAPCSIVPPTRAHTPLGGCERRSEGGSPLPPPLLLLLLVAALLLPLLPPSPAPLPPLLSEAARGQ